MNFKKYNLNTPQQLLDFMQANMQYGFTYRGKVFTGQDIDDNFDKLYKLRLGEDFIKSGYGVCWDYCELGREFFAKTGVQHECYCLESFTSRAEGGPTHTFALYKQGKVWYWFEYAWSDYCGIHKYNTKQEALKDIFAKFAKSNNKKQSEVRLYKTSKVTKRLNSYQFMQHCLNCPKIDIQKL